MASQQLYDTVLRLGFYPKLNNSESGILNQYTIVKILISL